MTINFQQVNNNPFVVGQVSESYNTGVSVGDIKELYELLGYTESEDMASQLLSTAGFSLIGAAPEVIKSVKYRDDVRAAYRIATSVTDNKFEQFNLSNRFEDLLIGETKAYNRAKGKTFWGKIKSWWNQSSTKSAGATPTISSTTPIASTKTKTNMATDGVIHEALNITKDEKGVNIDITGFNVAKKGSSFDAGHMKTNMQTVSQILAETAGETKLTDFTTIKDLNNISDTTINEAAKAQLALDTADDTAKALGKAASASVSNIKTVSKSVAKEAFGGVGLLITAITGLTTELPSIVTAFKQNSNEGWAQLGKSAATIAISDVGCSAAGQILGGTLGFALGGLLGPVGASIGGAIGKTIGASVGSILGRKLSSWIFGKSTTEKQQDEQIEEQAQTVASSQINLQSFLAQAKQQAASETDSKKAQQINAKIQAIENKLTSNVTTNAAQNANPFVTVQ